MQEIDEVAGLLNPTDVQQAKYGDKPCTAADLLMAAAKAAAKQGKKFLADLASDSEDSGAENVGAVSVARIAPREGETGETVGIRTVRRGFAGGHGGCESQCCRAVRQEEGGLTHDQSEQETRRDGL